MAGIQRHVLFAGDLFTYLARKYKILSPSADICNQSFSFGSDFTDDIGNSILLLSYTYRKAFRKQIFSLLPMILLDENIILYANIFSRRTYYVHSSFRFFIICSLISELYLFRYFHNLYSDGVDGYVRPAMKCFRTVYEMILQKYFNPLEGWPYLQRSTRSLCRGYETLKPLIHMEDPFKPSTFLDAFSTFTESKISCQTNATSRKIQEDRSSEVKVPQNVRRRSGSSLSVFASQDNPRYSNQSVNEAATKRIGKSDPSKLNSNLESVTGSFNQSASLQEDVCAMLSSNKETVEHKSNKSEVKKDSERISESDTTDRSEKVDTEETTFVVKKVSLDEMKQNLTGKSIEFLSFGSVDEIKNLISELPDAPAVVFDDRCFDDRKEVKLAEAVLLADKTIHFADSTAAKESSVATGNVLTDRLSNTKPSSDKSNVTDLERASKEKTESEIAGNKGAINKPWQPKKKAKKSKHSKKR